MFSFFNKNLKKLVSLSSEQLGPSINSAHFHELEKIGPLGKQLFELLKSRNGFYAFENALHVFPLCDTGNNFAFWNKAETWKASYGSLISHETYCFGEDIFGVQFAISNQEIIKFDPETGETGTYAKNLEEWAKIILENYEVETGHPLAREWQMENGALLPGHRLLPITPFVIGGEFNTNNLFSMDAVAGMRLRGEIAQKISHLPDGTVIQLSYSS